MFIVVRVYDPPFGCFAARELIGLNKSISNNIRHSTEFAKYTSLLPRSEAFADILIRRDMVAVEDSKVNGDLVR